MLQVFRSRWDTRAYLPNSPLSAGAPAPSASALPGHKAIAVSRGTRKQHTEGFTRRSQSAAVLQEGGPGLAGSLRAFPVPSLGTHRPQRLRQVQVLLKLGKKPSNIKFSPPGRADYEAALKEQLHPSSPHSPHSCSQCYWHRCCQERDWAVGPKAHQ